MNSTLEFGIIYASILLPSVCFLFAIVFVIYNVFIKNKKDQKIWRDKK
jgi:hypothetical protein